MRPSLENKLNTRQAVIGVIGLGYIGLTLIEAFLDAGFSMAGYDRNPHRIHLLNQHTSYLNFMNLASVFTKMDSRHFVVSSDPSILNTADVLIICVPTSLDNQQQPDLTALRAAFQTVLTLLKKGQLIILQSTTYPGTTEQELLPILHTSSFKVGKDFYLGYVPEVCDIGTPKSFTEIPKIIGGMTPTCLKLAKLLYKQARCSLFTCSSPKVAEAAKILQNSYRLVNISLINEMKILFDRMGIDIWEVISAASTKPFGFTPFYPSPGIGGDCIPVDPYYLIWKAKCFEAPTSLIELAGNVNKTIPYYVVSKIIEGLNLQKKSIKGSKILVLGVGYKKDVNDIRESPSLKILSILEEMHAKISYHDPLVDQLPPLSRYPHLHLKGAKLHYHKLRLYDAVVIGANHSCYNWTKIVKNSSLVIDPHHATASVKGCKRHVVKA